MSMDECAMGRGAHGLRLDGFERRVGDAGLEVVAPPHWPALHVVTCVGPVDFGPTWVGADDARVVGTSSTSRLWREPLSVELTVANPHDTGEVLQPFLATAAAVASRWLGRQAFHAGAFLADSGVAVAVLGAKGAGKSTMLATLAGAGASVFTDDLLVVDRTTAFAGPRCVDLRGDAANVMGVGIPLGVVGARERWRVLLPPVEPEVTLGGWILPEWGDRVEIVSVPLAQRLPLLLQHLAVLVEPPSPEDLLHLAVLPCWRLVRPRRWDVVDEVVSAVMAAPTCSSP
jgi:hypothetical protein